MADKENKLGQTQRKLQAANTFVQNRMCTEMGTPSVPHSLFLARRMQNTRVWQYVPLHQKGVRAVIFFNKRMKHRGGGRKVNGLLQLDCSVCGAKALQTHNYKHRKGCKCGIARTPHQEHLCARLPRGDHQEENGGLKRLSAVAALSNLSAIWTPRGWVMGRQILKLYKMPTVSAMLVGIHNLSADSYDRGETLAQCTTRRLPLFSCNFLTQMTIFIVS